MFWSAYKSTFTYLEPLSNSSGSLCGLWALDKQMTMCTATVALGRSVESNMNERTKPCRLHSPPSQSVLQLSRFPAGPIVWYASLTCYFTLRANSQWEWSVLKFYSGLMCFFKPAFGVDSHTADDPDQAPFVRCTCCTSVLVTSLRSSHALLSSPLQVWRHLRRSGQLPGPCDWSHGRSCFQGSEKLLQPVSGTVFKTY